MGNRTLITFLFFLISLSNCFSNNTEAEHEKKAPSHYILLNGVSSTSTSFDKISSIFGTSETQNIQVGVAFIISYLDISPEEALQRLTKYLSLSEQYNLPVLVQLDGEAWWSNRPDLWNWWDKSKPGFNPENRANVEWTSWTPDSAIKVGWRNWENQIRVLPMPNLMSPRYREASRTELKKLIPVILNWYRNLPEEKKYLLAGIKLGWESSLGVNNWYYPNGNSYVDKAESEDPTYGTNLNSLPDRGVCTIGYAAVKTAGIAKSGKLTEKMQAKVVARHLEDWCELASELGVPRKLLFTHVGSWVEGENHYYAALNKYSCPGWSFYKYAGNPKNDLTAMDAVKKGNAPFWAATEWLFQGEQTRENWISALQNTLGNANARYVCIYNWSSIEANTAALEAIKEISNTKFTSRWALNNFRIFVFRQGIKRKHSQSSVEFLLRSLNAKKWNYKAQSEVILV